MPLYRNDTSLRQVIGGQAVEPGGTVTTTIYLSPLPAGIVLVEQAPMANPILYSAKLTSTTTINVPEGASRFQIHFYVEDGSASIKFNDASNTPSLELYKGAKWNEKCLERIYDKIIVTVVTGPVYVIIERV